MKAVIQRVTRGSVTVNNQIIGAIGKGFVVLLGIKQGDTSENASFLAKKTANLRVFSDESDKMNLSLKDINGEILIISQFTLYADTKKGNRPSFVQAADPQLAEKLYHEFTELLCNELGPEKVATGRFGAMMTVEIINDGPVTIELSTD